MRLDTLRWSPDVCLVTRAAADDSPTLVFRYKVFVLLPGASSPRDYLRGLLLDYLKSYVSGYTAEFITIADLFISSCAKRQTTPRWSPTTKVSPSTSLLCPSAYPRSIRFQATLPLTTEAGAIVSSSLLLSL